MSFLIFSRAHQFIELYDLLIPALEEFAAVELPVPASTSVPAPVAPSNGSALKDVEPAETDVSDPEAVTEMQIEWQTCDDKTDTPALCSDASGVASERLWMGPAVLILDLMSQSLLVDKSALKVALEELEKMSHMQQLFSGNNSSSSSKLSGLAANSQGHEDFSAAPKKNGISRSQSQSRPSHQSEYAVSLDFIQELKDEFLDKKDSVASYKRKRKLAAIDDDDTDDISGEDLSNPYSLRDKYAFHASYIPAKKISSATEDADGGVGVSDLSMADSRLPLAACGLSTAKKARCADICLRLIRQYSDYKHKIDAQTTFRAMSKEKATPTPSPSSPALPSPIPIDSSLPQAAVQLLVHVTRDKEVTAHFERSGGVHALISTIPPFEGTYVTSCIILYVTLYITHPSGTESVLLSSSVLSLRQCTLMASHIFLLQQFVQGCRTCCSPCCSTFSKTPLSSQRPWKAPSRCAGCD